MQTKLTLRLDQTLVEKPKVYAAEHGKSVSQMVADYFSFLDVRAELPANEHAMALGQKTQTLQGILKNAPVSEEDYNRFRDEKFL